MFLFSLALAAPPDKIAGEIEIESQGGDIDLLVFSDDLEVIAGRATGNDSVFVLELESWQVSSLKPCNVSALTMALGAQEDHDTLIVGCDDGTATTLDYDRLATSDKLTQEGDDQGSYTWNVASNGGPLRGMFWDGGSNVYTLESTSPAGLFHVFSLDTVGAVDADVNGNYPFISAFTGFVDGFTDAFFGIGYLAHGSARMSTVNLGSGVMSNQNGTATSIYGIDDLAFGLVRPWAVDTDLSLLLQLDTTAGSVVSTVPTVTSPTAVAEGGDQSDGWLMVAGDELRVHQLVGGQVSDLNDPFYVNTSGVVIKDAIVTDNYVFGGGDGGQLHVVTTNPWIYPGATVTPATAVAGETVTVDFNVDEDSTWQVCLGGDRTSCATELATGQADGGSQGDDTTAVSVQVAVSGEFREGTNQLYIRATDAAGNVGHRPVSLVVDNPPSAPTLPADALGFADGALTLSFPGIDDDDLASYEIYISDVAFTRADFADEDFLPENPSVDDGPTNPITIEATGGQSVATTIGPLSNATTYYVAVRAVDDGGLESEMSNVVTGTPETTFTASQLAGEDGGSSCSTGATGPISWGVLAGLFGIVARRRRASTDGPATRRAVASLARVGLVGLGVFAAINTAFADEAEKPGDITKQYGNFELRYGGFLNLQDEAITSVFGGGHNMLQVEAGPQVTRFFEIDVQAGFYQELGTTVTAAGAASARRTMLTMFPLGLSVSARLHIIDEQVIVPYGRYGVDFVYWTELTDVSTGSNTKAKVQGTKMGQHFALGAGLLLDVFAPSRASLLEAYSGINDTYITFEFRRQLVDSRRHPWGAANTDGFTFTGNMITVGLKLDY